MMILDQIDEESKRDKIRSDLDKNLFIEAGAGAGKTSLLVDRVTNLLQKPGVKPEEIVVITFTNAAAGELYDRVAVRLRAKAEEEDAPKQIREAYAHLDRIHISTIHHFCHEILSQRTFDADLVLDLQMEEAEDTEAREDRFLDAYMASSTGAALRDIRAAFGSNYVSCIRDTFYRLADRKDAEYIYDKEIAAISADKMRGQAYEICVKFAGYIRKTISDLAAAGIHAEFSKSKGGEESWKILNRAIARYKSGMNRDLVFTGWKRFMRTTFQLFGTPKGSGNQELKQANADFADFTAKVTCEWIPIFEEWKADRVLLYVLGAVDEYQKQPESKYISNDRLLYETQDLLRNDAARRYLKERYRYLFVDEYQDTDDMQTEIIWNLAMDESDHDRLQDGALVVVGDPKQAIYRFRGADSTLFEKTRKRMQDLPNVLDVTLQNNYRSSGSIITWVNNRFGKLWNEPEDEADAGQVCKSGYTEMLEGPERNAFGREDSEGSFLCGAYFCNVKKTKDKPQDKSSLVQLVQNLTDGTHQIAVKDDRTHGFTLKTVGYEDILILTWYMTDIPLYVKAFKEAGIPANVYGAITFEETFIRRFVAILHYLADPENKNAFANARQALMHKDLSQMGSCDNEAASRYLGEIRKETSEMSPKAIVHYLKNHPEYWLDWDCDISANDLYNARKSVINMVEQIDASDNNTLTEITAYVNKYIDDKHEREAEISADVKQIRMMNVHKAKGLEGHIVIIADRDDIKRYSSSYKDGRKFYEVVSYTDMDGATPQIFETFASNSEIKGKAEAASQLDQERLEYVAATRAAEVLIFMGQTEKSIDCPFNDVKADTLPDIYSVMGEKQQKETEVETSDGNIEENVTSTGITEFKYSMDDLSTGDNAPSFITLNPSRLASEDDTDIGGVKKAAGAADRPSGNVFGTVMHRCFELLVMRRARIFHADEEVQNQEISKLIRQAMMESMNDIHDEDQEQYRSYLMQQMRIFLGKKELIQKIEDAAEVHTELGFSYYVNAGSDQELAACLQPFITGIDLNGSKLWVNGTADLVLVLKDGKVKIIDYKSNVRGNLIEAEFRDRMNQKYAGQLLLYRYAMARLYKTNLDDISAALYLLDGDAEDGMNNNLAYKKHVMERMKI